LRAAAWPDAQDGRTGRPDRQIAGTAGGQGWPSRSRPRRARRAPHDRHHPLDDAIGTPQARPAEGQPQAPHRGRRWRASAGGQSPAQSVRANANDDEEDERRRPDEDDAPHGWVGWLRRSLSARDQMRSTRWTCNNAVAVTRWY